MSHLWTGGESVVKYPTYEELGWLKAHKRLVPTNENFGIGTYFSNQIVTRINEQKPCNVIYVGEPGISKTYCAISFARYIQPSFSINQIVMTYAEFMQCMINLKEGEIIVFDEPEYAVGHRDWYRAQNKALVNTMRSGRFKIHPVFVPCINKGLLDVVIRSHLLQYMVRLTERGEGVVYKFEPSPFENITYNKHLCNIKIEMLDVDKCEKTWCYSCKDFRDNSCQLLRAQYEHKRENLQNLRYGQDLEKSLQEEAKKVSFEEWLERAYEHFLEFLYVTPQGKEKISTEKICLVLKCNQTTAQRIRLVFNQMSREELAANVRRAIENKEKPKESDTAS